MAHLLAVESPLDEFWVAKVRRMFIGALGVFQNTTSTRVPLGRASPGRWCASNDVTGSKDPDALSVAFIRQGSDGCQVSLVPYCRLLPQASCHLSIRRRLRFRKDRRVDPALMSRRSTTASRAF